MISSSAKKQFLSELTKTNVLPIVNGDYLKRFKTSQIDPLTINRNNKDLAEEFFFRSHSFSDLILVVQDKELYVDKSVLSAVSKIFRSYCQDEKISSIELVDVSPNDMIELLQFLYPQFQCTINYQTVTILLILANRFEINFISNACRTFILLYLSKFNYIDKYPNSMNLIEQEDGSRVTISSILDVLCIWLREFFYTNDESTWKVLLEKLSRCNNSKFYTSNALNDLEENIRYKIYQARAKYLEKSRRSIVSDVN